MTWNDNAAGLVWVLVDVMAAAVTFDPPFPLKPRRDFRPVGFGLGPDKRPRMRKYWRT
jgi:hypothetical protein